ncbi:hypothetical protein PR048_006047 [Dryococelus australis]|uniref:Uncharacterized protein n=1 Tax=Dryococelus australis TaxID=614101 RepID=A0ABQ9I9W8_9NEOP|nr:hypothetical protein PR048_006047 [Dryococelus australis]
MPLVDGFSRDNPVCPTPAFRCSSMSTSLHPHRFSRPSGRTARSSKREIIDIWSTVPAIKTQRATLLAATSAAASARLSIVGRPNLFPLSIMSYKVVSSSIAGERKNTPQELLDRNLYPLQLSPHAAQRHQLSLPPAYICNHVFQEHVVASFTFNVSKRARSPSKSLGKKKILVLAHQEQPTRHSRVPSVTRGPGGVVVRLVAYHLSEPGSILGGVTPRFSHLGIAPDDATGQRFFSEISRFPRPCILALLHNHLT